MRQGKDTGKVRHPPCKMFFRFVPARLAAAFVCPAFLGTAECALEADVVTSRGTVTIELDYGRAPRTVANFISLAEGSRAWLDPSTGAVKAEPFYAGHPFTRVEDSSSSKLAEAGAISGPGGDGPGYTLPDEFDPALVHQPYIVAMSSEGPNTGGSRWYFAGDTALASRDLRDVVFGRVSLPASRAVVDSIIDAGAGNTEIEGITIRRGDPAAEAFDELSADLPVVSAAAGTLSAVSGGEVGFLFPQPASSVLRCSSSADLVSWAPAFRGFVAFDAGSSPGYRAVDIADAPRKFYHFSLVSSPSAGGPSGFANRRLIVTTSHAGKMTYDFDSSGLAGTCLNQPFPEFPEFTFSGPFSVRSDILVPVFEPYFFRIHIETAVLGDTPNQIIRGGFDTIEASRIVGRQFSDFYSASMVPVFAEMEAGMPLELDRP